MSDRYPQTQSVPRYSEEEIIRFRELFAPIAKQYRSGSRLAWFIVIASVILLLIGYMQNIIAAGWFFGAVIVCWIVAGLIICRSVLVCPACRGKLDSLELGRYCPECGAADIIPAGVFHPPCCGTCHKELRRGGRSAARSYRIHACTHCGLALDLRGF
jgi:hypothetical protein